MGLPKQGAEFPWKLFQNDIKDVKLLRKGDLEDGVLTFARVQKVAERREVLLEAC
jgi:monooxygenase